MKTYSMHIRVTCIVLCSALLVGGCGGSGSDEGSASKDVSNLLCLMIFPLCIFQKAAEPGPGQSYLKAADLLEVVGMSQDTQRNGYAAGYASKPDGDLDAVVQKLDPDGNLLWTRRFGSPDREYAEQIEANSDGTVTTTIVKYWSVDGDPGRRVQEHYRLQLSESGEVLAAWQAAR